MKVSFNNKNEKITVEITTESLKSVNEDNEESSAQAELSLNEVKFIDPEQMAKAYWFIWKNAVGPYKQYYKGFYEGTLNALKLLQEHPEAFYDERFLEKPSITFEEWKARKGYNGESSAQAELSLNNSEDDEDEEHKEKVPLEGELSPLSITIEQFESYTRLKKSLEEKKVIEAQEKSEFLIKKHETSFCKCSGCEGLRERVAKNFSSIVAEKHKEKVPLEGTFSIKEIGG